MAGGIDVEYPIVLASGSPRRKRALATICKRFVCARSREPKRDEVADGKKRARGGPSNHRPRTPLESARLDTRAKACAKAQAAARRYPRALVIAADTLVVSHGHVMGKPASRRAALAMLTELSNQRMIGITSICALVPGRRPAIWTERGWVRFRKIAEDEQDRYLTTGTWRGKAGAVNIEEKPVRDWIGARGGEWGAIVGLPVGKLKSWLGAQARRPDKDE